MNESHRLNQGATTSHNDLFMTKFHIKMLLSKQFKLLRYFLAPSLRYYLILKCSSQTTEKFSSKEYIIRLKLTSMSREKLPCCTSAITCWNISLTDCPAKR